jgi:hypothetical protein
MAGDRSDAGPLKDLPRFQSLVAGGGAEHAALRLNDRLISSNGTDRASRVKLPSVAISVAAARNPLHAARAKAPPTLIRLAPSSAASATVMKSLPTSRFTGLGC